MKKFAREEVLRRRNAARGIISVAVPVEPDIPPPAIFGFSPTASSIEVAQLCASHSVTQQKEDELTVEAHFVPTGIEDLPPLGLEFPPTDDTPPTPPSPPTPLAFGEALPIPLSPTPRMTRVMRNAVRDPFDAFEWLQVTVSCDPADAPPVVEAVESSNNASVATASIAVPTPSLPDSAVPIEIVRSQSPSQLKSALGRSPIEKLFGEAMDWRSAQLTRPSSDDETEESKDTNTTPPSPNFAFETNLLKNPIYMETSLSQEK